MRIALAAPLHESVPPRLYGGTERVVAHLANELVALGHEVTLFASGDSRTRARLVPICPRALRLDSTVVDPLAWHFLLVERAFQRAHEFDVLHFHCDYLHFPLSRRLTRHALTTLHGRLDLPDLVPLYREFRDQPLVSISDAQRSPLPWANWVRTIHHGIPEQSLSPRLDTGDYLAFLGRISPEKRVDRAIEIAKRAGLPLRIAAKVSECDQKYFEREIAPLLDTPGVSFVGEISGDSQGEFLGGARALLFPIDWPEPFGLVMIEAIACGTPVIAWNRGSVPEVVEPGVSGWIVNDLDDAAAAARDAHRLDRAGVRRAFERRFTARRMAREYLEAYDRVIAEAGRGCVPAPTN